MTEVSFHDYYRLLEEWKEIVELANSDLNIRENANSKIDKIIAELKKPIEERNCNTVLDLLNDLKKIRGLAKYVSESLEVIMTICYME